MPITITTKTAVVSVLVDMTVDQDELLLGCLAYVPADSLPLQPLRVFLTTILDAIVADSLGGCGWPGGALDSPPEPIRARIESAGTKPVPVPATASEAVLRRAHRDTRRKQIDRDWLLEQYVTLGRSTTDIALELACSISTISKYMREYGITARKRNGGCHAPSDPTPAPAKTSPGGGYAGTSPGRGASAGSSD